MQNVIRIIVQGAKCAFKKFKVQNIILGIIYGSKL